MKKRIIIISCFALVLLLLLLGFLYYVFFNPFLKISLKGKDMIELEVAQEYQELGAKVEGTNKKYQINSNVDTSKVGTYEVIYRISILKTIKTVKRQVIVKDLTLPIITLTGSDVSIFVGESFRDPGYVASDNYDGDLTSKVVINHNIDTSKMGEYEVNYEVSDTNGNKISANRKVFVKEKLKATVSSNLTEITYINGILLVNKKYALPSNYNPGVDSTAYQALLNMQNDASNLGYSLTLVSGFRSYQTQKTLYNRYVAEDGQALADTYSARPGHSEHQSGLAFDVGYIGDDFGETPSGIWLKENCHKYGFIIRYLKGKESITGYKYEPWHIRYVGIDHATNIMKQGITLEEYLGVN